MAVLSPAQIAGYAKGPGRWAGNDVVIATAIALAESSGRTDAVNRNTNGSTDKGVWQVNTIHRFPGNLFDPSYNAQCARRVFDMQGWRAWTVYKSGAYQRHMNAARQGAAGAANVAGAPAADSGPPPITYGPPGPQIVVAGRGTEHAAQGVMRSPFAAIQLYNKPLGTDIARRVVGEVAYAAGVGTIPSIKVNISDPGGRLYAEMRPLWRRGTLLTYLNDFVLRVDSVKFTGGNAGTGQIEIEAIDALIYALQSLTGPRSESNMAATQFLAGELKLAGYDPNKVFLGESVPTQSVIARDVPAAPAAADATAADLAAKVNASRVKVPGGDPKIVPDDQNPPGSEVPSGWTTGVRFSKELGKRIFTSGHRLVFGGAGFAMTWCSELNRIPRIGWYYATPAERWMQCPEVSRVGVGKINGVIQVKGKVPLERARAMRPGVAVDIFGTPGIENMRMMLTDVAHSIGSDTDGVDITLAQPIDAPPEPASQQQGGQNGAGSSGGGADGQVNTFVNLALQQAGDRYVFGAEVRLDDPNPSVWDCSELVEWAAWRAGIRPKMPDGSSAQRAHCRAISVGSAINTKGALLFRPGHVAISLGNGRTIEAYTTGKPVGSRDARAGGYTGGGLIPGAQGYQVRP